MTFTIMHLNDKPDAQEVKHSIIFLFIVFVWEGKSVRF